MQVYGFKEALRGEMEIDNLLSAMQEYVCGYIEVLRLTDELDLVCNEEGKIHGLDYTAAWIEESKLVELIAGNCFVCRHDNEGNFSSILPGDIPVISQKLKSVNSVSSGGMLLLE